MAFTAGGLVCNSNVATDLRVRLALRVAQVLAFARLEGGGGFPARACRMLRDPLWLLLSCSGEGTAVWWDLVFIV